ncbi:MAG: DinB family protein [Acidobacteriota bacterium]
MHFNLDHAIDILSRTPMALQAMLQQLPAQLIQSNEGDQTWSPFDVVGHLIHGEQTDWLPRARMILQYGEAKAFEPFDRFAQFEVSKGKTLEELLNTFAQLRAESIQTLKNMNLTAEDFEKRGKHPELGIVRLGELLSTWVVHDLDHLVQISRTLAKQYKEAVGPWQAYLSVLK